MPFFWCFATDDETLDFWRFLSPKRNEELELTLTLQRVTEPGICMQQVYSQQSNGNIFRVG